LISVMSRIWHASVGKQSKVRARCLAIDQSG
jgi:hypothetical protein